MLPVITVPLLAGAVGTFVDGYMLGRKIRNVVNG